MEIKSGSRVLLDGFQFYDLNSENKMHKIARAILTAISLPFFACCAAVYNTAAAIAKATFLNDKKGALEHAVFAVAEGLLCLGNYYLSIPIALAYAFKADAVIEAHKWLTGEEYHPPAIMRYQPPSLEEVSRDQDDAVVVGPAQPTTPLLLEVAAKLYAALGLGGSTSEIV